MKADALPDLQEQPCRSPGSADYRLVAHRRLGQQRRVRGAGEGLSKPRGPPGGGWVCRGGLSPQSVFEFEGRVLLQQVGSIAVSYTHLRAHETSAHL
eukprot:15453098-Alexandrium_andersonii.AAC.1